MHVTLDQARALDAFARLGTYQAAGQALRRAHTAVLHQLKQLEAQVGLRLFDRSGYRTRLTPQGEAVLGHCRALLVAEASLVAGVEALKSGWEPVFRVVFDGIYPAAPLLDVVRTLIGQGAPTRVEVSAEFLSGVEDRFESDGAQAMVTVLPPRAQGLVVHALPRLTARLLAHRAHPLAKLKRRLTPADLSGHLLLSVRGSDPRLNLATAPLDTQSRVHLPDFHSKKTALLGRLGFGWLPDWLVDDEVEKGTLVPLKLQGGSVHAFEPRLVLRASATGRVSRAFVDALRGG